MAIHDYLEPAVTLIVGFIAFWLYQKQKRDSKKDAANILLLEIQNAKRQLAVATKQLKDAGTDETKMLAEDTFLMPNESWSKYKYLFVRDFDRDEWDSLSSFYSRCAIFDDAVIHNNKAFPQNAEQIREAMSQAVTKILTEFTINNPTAKSGSKPEINAINAASKAHDLILAQAGALFSYSPRKPILDAQDQLTSISSINLEQHILKLKKIAHISS